MIIVFIQLVLLQIFTQIPEIQSVSGPIVNWVIGFMGTIILAMGGFIVKMWNDRNALETEYIKVLTTIKVYMEQMLNNSK